MNTLEFKLEMLSNKFYEFFWRSPELFLHRVENRLQRQFKSNLRLTSPRTTNALTWVRETDDFHTRLYLFNYWTDHYGLGRVPIAWRLRNQNGLVVTQSHFELAPREMKVIEAGDFLREARIPLPFVGNLHFERDIGGPGSGVPLKMLHEFYGKGFATPIHEYGTADNFRYTEFQVGVSIWAHDDVQDVELGMVNCNLAPSRRDGTLTIQLFNHKGQRKNIHSRELGSGHAFYGSLNALYPDWKQFIGSEPGNIALHFPHSIGRPLVFHRYRNGLSGCLNHLTGDKSKSPYVIQGETLKNVERGPVWTGGVIIDPQMTTYLTFILNWGFKIPYAIEGRLYDASGAEEAKFTRQFQPWETQAIDLGQFLPAEKRQKPWIGSVCLNVLPTPKLNFIPYSFDANIEFVGKGWRAPVNLGSCMLNLAPHSDVKSVQIGRTKNFMRIRADGNFDTHLLMLNQSSSATYETPSDTTLRLISQDGQREATQKISIPARGVFYQKVEDVFPEFGRIKGQADVVTLHIRDTRVKLNGIHLLRNKQTGVLSGDHYFGG